MFCFDPSGNALEFKAGTYLGRLLAIQGSGKPHDRDEPHICFANSAALPI